MEITGRIYSRCLEGMRGRFPSAFLMTRLTFSAKVRDMVFERMSLFTLRRAVASGMVKMGSEFLSGIPSRAPIEVVTLRMTIDEKDRQLNFHKDPHLNLIERAVERTTKIMINSATVEIDFGDHKRGIDVPLNFSSTSVRNGVVREKIK